MTPNIYDIKINNIDGSEKALSDYNDQVLLVVNVASKCGLTPQYEGLERLYEKYKDQGFSVLAFPANDFGAQEPGSNKEIKEFCTLNYGVKFPMFEKITVLGPQKHPLYQKLTSLKSKDGKEEIQWNFEKFLVNRNGDVVARFHPKTEPEDAALIKAIEHQLG